MSLTSLDPCSSLKVLVRGHGTDECEQAAFTEDVLPDGGTLVLLMSGDVEHRVRKTRATRQCLVGWFREVSEGRVMDLDGSSLRTSGLLDRATTLNSLPSQQLALSCDVAVEVEEVDEDAHDDDDEAAFCGVTGSDPASSM